MTATRSDDEVTLSEAREVGREAAQPCYGRDEAAAGRFQAIFTNHARAQQFYDRLRSNPRHDWYADPDSIKLNRANGRIVTWEVPADAELADELGRKTDRATGLSVYWRDMCDTVGYYGSSFGEPPTGAGRFYATLNGRPGTPSM